jgi:hypothetical protein
LNFQSRMRIAHAILDFQNRIGRWLGDLGLRFWNCKIAESNPASLELASEACGFELPKSHYGDFGLRCWKSWCLFWCPEVRSGVLGSFLVSWSPSWCPGVLPGVLVSFLVSWGPSWCPGILPGVLESLLVSCIPSGPGVLWSFPVSCGPFWCPGVLPGVLGSFLVSWCPSCCPGVLPGVLTSVLVSWLGVGNDYVFVVNECFAVKQKKISLPWDPISHPLCPPLAHPPLTPMKCSELPVRIRHDILFAKIAFEVAWPCLFDSFRNL